MNIKRYEHQVTHYEDDNYSAVDFIEENDGSWVRFEDHRKVVEEMQKEIDNLKERCLNC